MRVQWVENEEVQDALAALVRLLARQAAAEYHAEAQDSRGDEGVKQYQPTRRIALYGRHSTVMQSTSSSADQVASCAPLVNYLGGTEVVSHGVV